MYFSEEEKEVELYKRIDMNRSRFLIEKIFNTRIGILIVAIFLFIFGFLGGVLTANEFTLAATSKEISVSEGDSKLSELKKVSDFNDESVTIGVVDGYIFADSVSANLPDAEIKHFDSRENAYKALLTGSIDGLADDEPIIRARMRSMTEISLIDGYVEPSDYAFVFPKNDEGEKRAEEFSDYVSKIKEDGSLKKLDKKWFGNATDNKTSEDYSLLPNKNGKISVAFDNSNIPFAYLSAGKPVGYDIDLLIGFCKEEGYALELEQTEFSKMLEKVSEGKFDMGCGAITITDDRKEKLNFSEADYSGGISICVSERSKALRAEGKSTGEDENSTLGDDLVVPQVEESGGLRDVTYDSRGAFKAVLIGLLEVLIIIVISTILGTIFGIIAFALSRRANFLIRGITKLLVALVDITPAAMIVLIMYYLYYSDFIYGGIIASCYGFTMVFGEKVYRIISISSKRADGGNLDRDYRVENITRKQFIEKLSDEEGRRMIRTYAEKIIVNIKYIAAVAFVASPELIRVVLSIRYGILHSATPLVFMLIVYMIFIAVIEKVTHIIFKNFVEKQERKKI